MEKNLKRLNQVFEDRLMYLYEIRPYYEQVRRYELESIDTGISGIARNGYWQGSADFTRKLINMLQGFNECKECIEDGRNEAKSKYSGLVKAVKEDDEKKQLLNQLINDYRETRKKELKALKDFGYWSRGLAEEAVQQGKADKIREYINQLRSSLNSNDEFNKNYEIAIKDEKNSRMTKRVYAYKREERNFLEGKEI